MPLLALDPAWADFYAVGGFVVGVVGFGVTIWQVRKTKRAAEAAADAARRTLAESKKSYERFVGSFASRLWDQLQTSVNTLDWKLARVRCHDLAELLAALPASGSEPLDAATREAVDTLREFAGRFEGDGCQQVENPTCYPIEGALGATVAIDSPPARSPPGTVPRHP